MTSRRKTKNAPLERWAPSWTSRWGRRYRRCIAKGITGWVFFTCSQPDELEGRFSHARVLARKARCGRKRR